MPRTRGLLLEPRIAFHARRSTGRGPSRAARPGYQAPRERRVELLPGYVSCDLPPAPAEDRAGVDSAASACPGRAVVNLIARFAAYAEDFERSYADDDWSRLEQYFTEDATYSTPANGVRVPGRRNLLAVLRAAVSGFDRRCDSRTLVTTRGPREEGDQVSREWQATFTLAGAPDITVAGSERAVFRGDRILLLEVVLEPETLARLMRYREEHLLET